MEVREFGELTLYGPHPLERDEEGRLKYNMGDMFPLYGSMIVGTGLHITLAMEFVEHYAARMGRKPDEELTQEVCENLVALIIRGEHVVIRSIPDDMERCFRAADLLEQVVRAEVIRFTGRRDPKVREAFKLRGESWKMAPRYFTVEEIIEQIRLSTVRVGTENLYYYKMESGGRFITVEKFADISHSISDRGQFAARVHEVVDLYNRRNKQYVRELDFFKADSEKFDPSLIERLDEYVSGCRNWGGPQEKKAAELFRKALDNLRASVPLDFQRDDPNNPVWRNHMYSELNEVPPTEESMLGISGEFNMNILWLPGCRVHDDEVVMDPHVEQPVAQLLEDFFRCYGPLEYINMGRLMRSQSTKRAAGSYREVFIAVLRQRGSRTEQIRILRKVWRNVLYYLNRGHSLERAEELAEGYLQYTFDRRELLSLLGVNTPVVGRLSRSEELPGIGVVPVTFFDRPYIYGMATDKIPYYFFENEDFVRAQASLLGYEAGLNLIVGRSDPDTGEAYFGDGDELFQFGDDKFVPTSLVLADFTGTFADVVSPLERFLPFYADYLADMLSKVKVRGMERKGLLEIADLFIDAVERRIVWTRRMLSGDSQPRRIISRLVEKRDEEVNPVGVKWEKTLERLLRLDVDAFIDSFREELRRRRGSY